MTCKHEAFNALTRVGRIRLEDGGPIVYYTIELVVFCAQCKQRFEFIGLPMGASAYQPTVNIDGTEMRAPLMPAGQKPPKGIPCFIGHFGEKPN